LTNVKPPTHSAFGGRSEASRVSRMQTAKSIALNTADGIDPEL